MVIKLKPWQEVIVGIIFIIIGVVSLILGKNLMVENNEKSKTFIEVTGYVVDYEYQDRYDYESPASEIVEYVVDGETYRVTSSVSSTNPRSRGTEVLLMYNPSDPSDVIWVNDEGNLIILIVAVIFIIGGIYITIKSVIKLRHNTDYKIDNTQINTTSEPITNNQQIQEQINTQKTNQQTVQNPINTSVTNQTIEQQSNNEVVNNPEQEEDTFSFDNQNK